MRIQFFGDSYDIVKRFLLQSLAPGADWAAFPMFTHEVTSDDLAAFEAFLGVEIASPGVLTTSTDRSAHLAAPARHSHVFLDPDTGIRLEPCLGADAVKYVFGPELVELCVVEPARLILVFDQSVPFGSERQAIAITDKLAYFRHRGLYGFAYLSHACFVILSASEHLCHEARARLLATGLPSGRILPRKATTAGRSAGTR